MQEGIRMVKPFHGAAYAALVTIVLAALVVSGVPSAAATSDVERLPIPGPQVYVAVGDEALYFGSDEDGDGDHDLIGKMLGTAGTTVIASGPGNQWQPAVNGRVLVYVDQAPPDPGGGAPVTSRVVARDLITGATRELSVEEGLRSSPTVHGGRVAWVEVDEGESGSIVYCDLDVDDDGVPDFAESDGPAPSAPQVVVTGPGARSPSLGSAGLVYAEEADGDVRVMRKPDPPGATEVTVAGSTGGVSKPRPRTSGDLICWTGRASGIDRVYVRDLSAGTTKATSSSDSSSRLPVTDGTRVAWVEGYWSDTPSVWVSEGSETRRLHTADGVVGSTSLEDGLLAWTEVVDESTLDSDVFYHSMTGEDDGSPADEDEGIERLSGATRYDTAVAIAREAFDPGGDGKWPGVAHVVIASGADDHMVDSLPAAGLSWLYDAPLLIAHPDPASNSAAKSVLSEIVAANGSVDLHVVGGTASVSDAVYRDLAAVVPGSATAPDRIAGPDRYATAVAVARRIHARAGSEGKATPNEALVAAAVTDGNLFDALALSALSARRGAPVLLVRPSELPEVTRNELETLAPGTVVLAGGEGAISDTTKRSIDAVVPTTCLRWGGADRYATSVVIAREAIARGWLTPRTIGVAAMLPDALTGGGAVGRSGGPLLTTRSTSLHHEVAGWMSERRADIRRCEVYGGEGVLSDGVFSEIRALLGL